MSALVESLANLIRAKRDDGQKFILLLGAGASMSSGVKSTTKIMDELLALYGKDVVGQSVLERFDQLWRRTQDADRDRLLRPFLASRDLTPSPGYTKLARLIAEEYFDLVLTFNFDILLETALKAAPQDFKLIIRGETNDDAIDKLVANREPRVKLAKLHGSFQSADYFLFSAKEMDRYPPAIASFVDRVTRADMLICGYSFGDDCVKAAFARSGESIVSVNPGGAPLFLKTIMRDRRSADYDIHLGFDDFFAELYTALHPPTITAERSLHNPFKFLESYEESDAGSLMGRDQEKATFLEALGQETPPQVVVLWGPGRSGKTSLVKASLLPGLDSARYQGLYVRCQQQGVIEDTLPRELLRLGLVAPELNLADSLQQLGGKPDQRHVVLFLDQFDRVTGRFPLRTAAGVKEMGAFLGDRLLKGCHPNLTVVLVVTDEGGVAGRVIQECANRRVPTYPMECQAFDRAGVASIVTSLAEKGSITFAPEIVEDLAKRYEDSQNAASTETRLTLAHVQAICHLLASTRTVDFETYDRAFRDSSAALNQAINVCDIISFVEDFAWPEAFWLRNIIKVPLKESRDQIATFIKDHYKELMPRQGQRGGDGASGGPPP